MIKMRRFYPIRALFAAGMVATLSLACSDEPTQPPPPSGDDPDVLFSFGPAVAPTDVPEVRIDLPPEPRAWDTDDQALIEAIAAGESIAVIAIKEAESEHALDTGIRAAVSAEAVDEALDILDAEQGVEVFDLLENLGMVRVRMDPALAPALRQNPLVDFIEPRQYGEIAAQVTPWGIDMVRAPEAWTVTSGGGAKIEIIDTGHDQGHEDLPLLPNDNCSGAYGGCDDGHGHGTHVMGIATARDNTIGVVGVAPGISASDVYAYGACTDLGNCPTDEVTAGINAGIFSVDVISMSLEQQYDAAQSSAVAQAWDNNIVLVAAAGNNQGNTEIYPALYTNVLGVSGVQPDKSFADTSPCEFNPSSNSGSHVDLAAPFWALSTVPNDQYEDETASPGWCGTSMSTPHVSGAAALLRADHPTWTNQQIVDQLIATAEDRGTSGRDDFFGHGIVDAAEALGVTEPSPDPPSVAIDGPTQIQPDATCTWFSDVSGGTPPYSYYWTNDGQFVSSDPDYTGGKLGGSTKDYFDLKLTVTDAASASNSHEIRVNENESAPMCMI